MVFSRKEKLQVYVIFRKTRNLRIYWTMYLVIKRRLLISYICTISEFTRKVLVLHSLSNPCFCIILAWNRTTFSFIQRIPREGSRKSQELEEYSGYIEGYSQYLKYINVSWVSYEWLRFTGQKTIFRQVLKGYTIFKPPLSWAYMSLMSKLL